MSDVLYLDLEPDFKDKTIRIELNVVFWPIALTLPGAQPKTEFYVGSTGARIFFQTNKGKVTEYKRGALLKVDYENSYKRLRNSTVKLSPQIETGSMVKAGAGDVTFEKDEERTFTAKFSGFERVLADTNLGWGVKWDLKLPPGQVIRDYLEGNLYLYVEFSWDNDHRNGSIELTPSDILFFDSNRRVVTNPAKLLAMRFFVRKQINFKQNLKVRVKEVE
jgi:hypothetical protein